MRTVKVPAAMEGAFEQAEEIVSKYFRERSDDPSHGAIEIHGERYVLVRAASLSVEFFRVVHELYGPGREREADEFAQNILFDLAHTIGKSDARNFHAKMGLVDPIARLSAGPVHFSHTGWAFVDIFPESAPAPDDSYFLVYEHPYSFESDAWLRAGQKTEFAACIMNAGYSSGWCAESFGMELVATEVLCRARGDDSCRFVMAPPHRITELAAKYVNGHAQTRAAFRVPDFFARKRIDDEAAAHLAQAQRLESIGRLAGGIAHDFNNLMAVIIGNAGLATKQLPPDHPACGFLYEIAAAGERAASLTRQLLAFSRAQASAPELLDLKGVVAELGRMLERLIGEDVELIARLADVELVEADRAQVEQVVVNLVVNARDAMPHGGTLMIETTPTEIDAARANVLGVRPGRFVSLSVSDDGVGMTEDVAAHVFDPFFTTKQPGKGTGLGLSTVYGITKRAGGAITVTTEPRAGSRFTVLLPSRAQSSSKPDDDKIATAPGRHGDRPPRRGRARAPLHRRQRAPLGGLRRDRDERRARGRAARPRAPEAHPHPRHRRRHARDDGPAARPAAHG